MTDKNLAKKPKTPQAKGKAAPKRQRVDWEAVERDYRTGKFTLRQLEANHGISYAEISRKSKKEKWTKDLREVIKQATDAAVLRESVTEAQKSVTDTILVAAEIGSKVILSHRTGLQRIAGIKETLLNQIEQAASNLPELGEVIEMIRNPDENGTDKANDQMRKAMSRSSLVDDLKKLAEVDERVRKGEREAFNLNAEQTPDSEISSLLKSLGSRSAFQVVK